MSNQAQVVALGTVAAAMAGAVASTIGLEAPATLLVAAGVTAIDAIASRKAALSSAPDQAESSTPTDNAKALPTEVPVPSLNPPDNPPPAKPEATASVPKSGGRAPRRKVTK